MKRRGAIVFGYVLITAAVYGDSTNKMVLASLDRERIDLIAGLFVGIYCPPYERKDLLMKRIEYRCDNDGRKSEETIMVQYVVEEPIEFGEEIERNQKSTYEKQVVICITMTPAGQFIKSSKGQAMTRKEDVLAPEKFEEMQWSNKVPEDTTRSLADPRR